MTVAVALAGFIAMSSALFGAVMARIFWADDLAHTQQLKEHWDRQETAMQSTIDSLTRQVEFLQQSRKKD